MLILSENLDIPRCPHCAIASPNLPYVYRRPTSNITNRQTRDWGVYCCGRCGGLVIAWSHSWGTAVQAYFPMPTSIKEDIPDRPRVYLQQALESLHAPAGAVMLAAAAVDSMLKLKGYSDGTLCSRIDKAASEHLLTKEMALWAHEIRLDANAQRHADEKVELPTEDEAKRTTDFALALAEFLFVLPSRVQRGIGRT